MVLQSINDFPDFPYNVTVKYKDSDYKGFYSTYIYHDALSEYSKYSDNEKVEWVSLTQTETVKTKVLLTTKKTEHKENKARYVVVNNDAVIAIIYENSFGRTMVVQNNVDLNFPLSVYDLEKQEPVTSEDFINFIWEMLPNDNIK